MEENVHGFDEGAQQRNKKEDDPLQGFECSICVEKPIQPVMTKCGHIFCYGCITNWLNRTVGSLQCPTCKKKMSKDELEPVLGERNFQHDERYENPNPDRGLTFSIFAAIGAIFTSGF